MNNTARKPIGSLTSQQVEAFNRDGFVIAKVFDEADFDPVKAEITAWIDAQARALHKEGLIRELHTDASFATRFGLLVAQDDSMLGGSDTTDILGDELFALMRHRKMLDAVSSLIGNEISLNPIQHLRGKPPAAQGRRVNFYEVPWHQDSGVTTPDADESLVITAWTPLGPATDEMGCMRLLKGFNRRGHVRHITQPGYGTTIDPALLPNDEPVIASCKPGDVVFMSQFTPHMSTPNVSQVCRWSLDLRYQAVGTPSGRAWFPSTVLRSIKNPESEVHDAAAWRASWRAAQAKPNPGWKHRVG